MVVGLATVRCDRIQGFIPRKPDDSGYCEPNIEISLDLEYECMITWLHLRKRDNESRFGALKGNRFRRAKHRYRADFARIVIRTQAERLDRRFAALGPIKQGGVQHVALGGEADVLSRERLVLALGQVTGSGSGGAFPVSFPIAVNRKLLRR